MSSIGNTSSSIKVTIKKVKTISETITKSFITIG